MILKKILLICLLLERVISNHNFLQKTTGSNFESVEKYVQIDNELRMDFLVPLVIEVPEGKYKAQSEVLIQTVVGQTLDNGKLRDFHKNYTTKRFGCDVIGYEPCPDGSTSLLLGKIINCTKLLLIDQISTTTPLIFF